MKPGIGGALVAPSVGAWSHCMGPVPSGHRPSDTSAPTGPNSTVSRNAIGTPFVSARTRNARSPAALKANGTGLSALPA